MKHIRSYEKYINGGIEVYRGTRSSSKLYDGMFFTVDLEYASMFGHNIEKYLIYPKKTLNLFEYNSIIREKLKDKEIYGLENFLHMHAKAIASGWDSWIDLLYNYGLEELADKFENELEECDSIYGADSGFDDSKVYYIKKKENVKKI